MENYDGARSRLRDISLRFVCHRTIVLQIHVKNTDMLRVSRLGKLENEVSCICILYSPLSIFPFLFFLHRFLFLLSFLCFSFFPFFLFVCLYFFPLLLFFLSLSFFSFSYSCSFSSECSFPFFFLFYFSSVSRFSFFFLPLLTSFSSFSFFLFPISFYFFRFSSSFSSFPLPPDIFVLPLFRPPTYILPSTWRNFSYCKSIWSVSEIKGQVCLHWYQCIFSEWNKIVHKLRNKPPRDVFARWTLSSFWYLQFTLYINIHQIFCHILCKYRVRRN